MSSNQPTARPKPIPVARPARPALIHHTPLDFESFRERFWTPEARKGLVISASIHLLLMVVLGFIYFNPPKDEVRVIDTRLQAGSEFGVDDGLNALGGLDSANEMPVPSATDENVSELTVLKPEEVTLDPSAGFAGNKLGNPGAGKGDGFGFAKFGQGGELVRGVAVKVGDPQFTLLWDEPVDLDLHVTEPGGKEISWIDERGDQGGELDVDNKDGTGPENIYWMKESKDGERRLSPGPSGEYKWFVYYYRGLTSENNPPARWKVRVKANGEVKVYQGRLTGRDQKSKVYSLVLEPSPERPK